MDEHPLRALPSVDRLLRTPALLELSERHGPTATKEALRGVLADARAEREPAAQEVLVERTAARLTVRPSLRPVLNATGVIVHTNLGRAPLPDSALRRVVEIAGGYSNLEYDLEQGARSSRHGHLGELIARATGAGAGLAVNNNAAAVLLCLAALAEGREVVVSRGELIEIGDGFRIPDILRRSQARLVEVGTTNRTRLDDYARALGPETAAIVRVHQSNFRMVGFTERPALEELAALAGEHDLPLVDDLGSGQLLDLPALADEPTARASLAAGSSLVCFSGDKLLGGPQAGVICGSADMVERVRRHPLHRAMRIDKLSLAALTATLELYADPGRALRAVPVLRMVAEAPDLVRARAQRLAERLGGEVVESAARVGGGAVPLLEIESYACALPGGEPLAHALRTGDPAVVGRVREGRLLLDCRTLTDAECELIKLP